MHIGMTECHYHFRVTVTLTSDLVFKNYCVWSISLIFFEVGIPNFVCECIMGWRSRECHIPFSGHYDLVSRIIVSGAYLLYYLM